MKALITGASSGIGKDLARVLAETYDELILIGRNKERLNELKEELAKKKGIKIEIISMDLTNKDHCIKLHNEHKEVDLLINNAGFGDCGSFTETSLEKEIDMIRTNIEAYHILTKLYLIDMKRKNKGQILNVASIAGFMPGPLMTTYYATKSYVVRLSEGIREELKQEKSNVKISILCPGPVDTNFNNYANVKFKLKGMNSYEVAKYAINHLNKFYITPGIGVKISRIFLQLLPGSLTAKIAYNVQRKKLYQNKK